jgi:CRP/FNR family cyclic AMP-dependent transcriptional regulator
MSDVSDKIHNLLADYPQRTYAAGQILLFAREDPDVIFYLESGRVRMYDVTSRGNEVVVNVYEPGKFFPLSWTLNHTPNRYFFKAEVSCRVRLVPNDDVPGILTADPEVTLDMLRRVFDKTERLFTRLVYLMSSSAGRRLMYELVVECRRFGAVQADGSYIASIREVDLASRSGLSRETVSREFQKLKERGFVKIEKQGIRVLDINKLEVEVGVIQ